MNSFVYLVVAAGVFGFLIAIISCSVCMQRRKAIDSKVIAHQALIFTIWGFLASLIWPLSIGIGICVGVGIATAEAINKRKD